jgi:hypothetical protein
MLNEVDPTDMDFRPLPESSFEIDLCSVMIDKIGLVRAP